MISKHSVFYYWIDCSFKVRALNKSDLVTNEKANTISDGSFKDFTQ